MSLPPPVIVGAGPAGVRAAQTLVAYGLRPVVVDEAMRAGGQVYRRPPVGFQRSPGQLYGFEATRAASVHAAFDGLGDAIDYRPQTLVWNAQPGLLDLLDNATRIATSLPWHDLVVATGATDRILPVPGWTLPGVYSLGGSQVALKSQGCAIGRRVVLAGTGPLLYLVAYQYVQAGACVAAVLDSSSLADRVRAVPAMLGQPAVLAKGLYYMAWLASRGVPLHSRAQVVRIDGQDRVQALVWQQQDMQGDGPGAPGPQQHIECDAVGFGHALRSETQLADLLGCRFGFDAVQRAHLPLRDGAGRTSVAGVYLAGDGAGIMGADAAELAGERAALALAQQRGITVDHARAAAIEAQLERIGRFRAGLERAFPFPLRWAASAPDALVVCRCENVTAGELRGAVRDCGAAEMNRLKALTRVGMGRCQGRMCGVAAAEILAQASGVPLAEVGRLRGQAPLKPIPLGMQVAPEAGERS
ncbi:NAD(P)/FAD-dependent oxidoreductase [Herbaspirillum sp. YR522]|uniref:FAD/NAD(P)-dependent oxidoreductase n=1 Tax=Herbaspirillum sp. YR522 TaxID=1144342 RepID=UPI00026FAB2F|nr:NAD(P)/FAD-dependent oxidoreductase [Herbaspirillum sp. YR522]EJN02837.1 NAD(FAD)-dependent dehydrogenase [Herbaspirillum sp. YR522]